MNTRRLLARLLRGDLQNVPLTDFERLLERLGFVQQRTAGSRRIWGHPSIPSQVNLQGMAGEAKPYQIRQVLGLLKRYNLELEDEQ